MVGSGDTCDIEYSSRCQEPAALTGMGPLNVKPSRSLTRRSTPCLSSRPPSQRKYTCPGLSVGRRQVSRACCLSGPSLRSMMIASNGEVRMAWRQRVSSGVIASCANEREG
eukprot:scaffold222611_cov40-Tisochrysis_lutea.AAC.2